jgi:hypothetical protein
VFIRAPADGRAHFFAMSLNSKGNRITFIDPPNAVTNSLGLSLRTAFPHRILNDNPSEDGILTITLKSGINGALSLSLHTPCLSVFFSLVVLVMVVVSNGSREEPISCTHSQIPKRYGIQTRRYRAISATWALWNERPQGNLGVQRFRVVVAQSQIDGLVL